MFIIIIIVIIIAINLEGAKAVWRELRELGRLFYYSKEWGSGRK